MSPGLVRSSPNRPLKGEMVVVFEGISLADWAVFCHASKRGGEILRRLQLRRTIAFACDQVLAIGSHCNDFTLNTGKCVDEIRDGFWSTFFVAHGSSRRLGLVACQLAFSKSSLLNKLILGRSPGRLLTATLLKHSKECQPPRAVAPEFFLKV